jgi:hypothetical protein
MFTSLFLELTPEGLGPKESLEEELHPIRKTINMRPKILCRIQSVLFLEIKTLSTFLFV